jgi:protease-4
LVLLSQAAHGDRFAEEPSVGVALPARAVSGDQDATAVALNPAGLIFLSGWHLELAYSRSDAAHSQGAGDGLGVFAALPVRLSFLPRLGFGLAVEALSPPRQVVAPDPGAPTRWSLAAAYEARPDVSFGLAWRYFTDDNGGALDGVGTVDLGLSARLGAHVSLGLVGRDLTTPVVAGVPVERHYEAELGVRPLGTDRLELAVGVIFADRRLDTDPRVRVGWRVARGLFVRGELEARSRWRLSQPAFLGGPAERDVELRGSLGLELSLGGVGAAFFGTGRLGDDSRLLGGTTVVRSSGEDVPSVAPRPRYIERIALEGNLSERALTEVVVKLRRLENDPELVAVLLVVDGLAVGWASLQDLRTSLQRLRQRGKKVFAYLAAGSTRDYYVCAVADKIYLDAAGGLRLQGMSSTVLFFKNLLDHLGMVAQFEKIEEYKSAPEQFTRDSSSEPAREMRTALLDDVYARVVADLARDRKREPSEVGRVFDQGPYTALEAGRLALVDQVVEPAELERLVAVELGGQYPIGEEPRPERSASWSLPQIAVVYIDGEIVDGKSMDVPVLNQHLVGGDTIAAAIRWAREEPQIEAVVLRIDSPGGSALASEMISREVFATRGHKPVVVSMGDVAASGGYFSAAGADVIYAQPSTITGSIGIYTGKVDSSALLQRIGITWETMKRGQRADMESVFRPYSDEERAEIKEKLRYYYGRFVSAVAKGRGLTIERVDEIARGRVWTGAQAKERGLVDHLGGLGDALEAAKVRAGLSPGDAVELALLPQRPISLLGQLTRVGGGGASGVWTTWTDPLLRWLPASWLVAAPSAPQARLPFQIVVE